MASAAGFLRNFAETITQAIADSDAEAKALREKLAEVDAENVRLRTLALADGIVYGGLSMYLMDATAATDDESSDRAA